MLMEGRKKLQFVRVSKINTTWPTTTTTTTTQPVVLQSPRKMVGGHHPQNLKPI
jgi:hypothetical protein